MKNLIFYSIIILLVFTTKSIASSCLINLKINNDINSFNLSEFENKELIPGINFIEVPVKFFCKQSKAKGTIIQLFFIKEKLKRITFAYQGYSDRPLFNVAQNFYKVGFKKNQNVIDMRLIEQYVVRKKDIIYAYENIKGDEEDFKNISEFFEIVDNSFEKLIVEYSLAEEPK